MVAEEGLQAIYKGATPTVLRQAANSAIRFTIYGAIKDKLLEGKPSGTALSAAESFAAGIVAGYVLAHASMSD
jgi:solute carrier family 25 citrate transporter 1